MQLDLFPDPSAPKRRGVHTPMLDRLAPLALRLMQELPAGATTDDLKVHALMLHLLSPQELADRGAMAALGQAFRRLGAVPAGVVRSTRPEAHRAPMVRWVLPSSDSPYLDA